MNQVATVDKSAVVEHSAPMSETGAVIALIERAARDPSIDIDKMERLIAMRSQMEAKASERAFDGAMTTAQAAMVSVKPDSNNSQTRSEYASYSALDRSLRPVYTAHGFALSFDQGDGAPEAHVRVRCRVSHTGGHSREYHIDMAADGKGAKGGDVMTKTHATGAAMTYGMRYLLKMIFNVAIGEDDTDGNMPIDKITAEQADELKTILEKGAAITGDYAGWINNLLLFAKVDGLNDIPAKDFGKVKAAALKAVAEVKK